MLRIIGGKWKGLSIKTSNRISYRPITSSLRTSFFNYLGHAIEGSVFLDGFAGTGILGFEALSRGASTIIFIENNKNAVSLIKRNINFLHAFPYASVIPIKIEVAFSRKKITSPVSIIFLDPPFQYPRKYLEYLISLVTRQKILQEDGLLCVRYEKFHGKLLPNDSTLHLLKEFISSETFLDLYCCNDKS